MTNPTPPIKQRAKRKASKLDPSSRFHVRSAQGGYGRPEIWIGNQPFATNFLNAAATNYWKRKLQAAFDLGRAWQEADYKHRSDPRQIEPPAEQLGLKA